MTARRGHPTPVICGVLLLAFLLSECAAPPSGVLRSVNHLTFRSRDGVLLYRIPEGWFDASADREAMGHAIWLIRENLNTTLAVEEIRMDDDVRQLVNDGALVEVGRMLVGLRAGKNGMVELRLPERRNLGGREVCLYELINPTSHEMHRVILFDTGERLYTATLIIANHAGNQIAGDSPAARVQDLFVEGLRW